MIQQVCPACGEIAVSSMGVSNTLLIALEEPTERDMEMNLPFSIHKMYTTAGYAMRTELTLAGLDMAQFRVAMFWMHKPNTSDACYDAGKRNILEEAKDKKAILLVGQAVVQEFTGYDVADVNGLPIESPYLSAPIIYPLINPTQIFSGGYGELRFGIREFTKRLKDEGLA